MAGPRIVSILIKDPPVHLYEFVDMLDAKQARVFTSRRAYVGAGNFPIWTSSGSSPIVQPAVLAADPAKPIPQITVQIDGFPKGADWEVSASFQPLIGAANPVVLFKASGAKWDSSGPAMVECALEPFHEKPTSARVLPWGLRGRLDCSFMSLGKVQAPQKIDIELYVLSKYISPYWQGNGIPLDLLRLETLLPTWMTAYGPHWPSFVVEALFADIRMTYDIWRGAESYVGHSIGGWNTSENVFWLDLWLSDMVGIIKRMAPRERYALNCSDLAFLVEAISSLGAFSQGSLSVLSIDPFGFINETYLIGRHQDERNTRYTAADLCNNPIYGASGKWSSLMKCPPKDPKRSSFIMHMIAFEATNSSGQAMVLDACTGPHHIAGKDKADALSQYISKAIDSNGPYNNDHPGPGTLKDVKQSGKIAVLAPRPSLIRANPVANPGDAFHTLYGTLALFFQGNSERGGFRLMDPCVGFIEPSGKGLITTWTVFQKNIANARDEEVHINVSLFDSRSGVEKNYEERKSKLSDYIEDTVQFDGSSTVRAQFLTFKDKAPCFFMFYYCTTKQERGDALLVTMDGTLDNPDFPFVEDNESAFWLTYYAIGSVELKKIVNMDVSAPNTAQKVGVVFEIEIKPSKDSIEWWRGALAYPRNGKALLLGTDVSPSGDSIRMHFLPLFAGSESIRLTLFGPNLDEATKDVPINITA